MIKALIYNHNSVKAVLKIKYFHLGQKAINKLQGSWRSKKKKGFYIARNAIDIWAAKKW